jgi:hypothetical protein
MTRLPRSYNLPSPALFSLLGHLDLDEDFEDTLPYSIEPIQPQPQRVVEPEEKSTAPSFLLPPTQSHAQTRISFDPRAPFFFPRPGNMAKAPGTPFHRTETEAQILARWEAAKGELTRGWKKRYREASKIRRRKGGKEEEELVV